VKLKAGTVKEVMRQSDELGTGLTRRASQ
jgi:hypothetical protein